MGQTGSSEGLKIEDYYHVQKVKLGQGSFGTVWRGVRKDSGLVVAVKQLLRSKLPGRGAGSRDVQRELAMTKACQHENILRSFDVFEDATSVYLVVEYCDGGDLGDKIKEAGGRRPEVDVAGWIRQVCAAVATLHQKHICHRDVKPDNFMVVRAGPALRLADFGLNVYAPPGKLLTEKCGTPAYMAPELFALPSSSPGYWLPVDAWAAGLIMFQLLCEGRHPFMAGGHLDTSKLTVGTLNFSDESRLSLRGLLGPGEAAEKPVLAEAPTMLCRGMVEPDPRRRLAAADALRNSWMWPPTMRGADHTYQQHMPPQQEEYRRHPSMAAVREQGQYQPTTGHIDASNSLHQLRLEHVEKQVADLSNELRTKDHHVSCLRADLAAAHQRRQSDELATRDAEIREAEIQDLRHELTTERDLASSERPRASLLDEIARQEATIAALRHELGVSHDDRSARRQEEREEVTKRDEQIEALHIELAKQRDQIACHQQELSFHADRAEAVSSVDAYAAAREQELNDRAKETANVTRDSADLRAALEQALVERDVARSEARQECLELASAKAQLQDQQSQIAGVEKDAAERALRLEALLEQARSGNAGPSASPSASGQKCCSFRRQRL